MILRYLTSLVIGTLLATAPRVVAGQVRIASTDLRLGQSRESALSKLRQAYRVDSSMSSPSADQWTIMSRSGPPYEMYGAVGFRDRRLSFASRIWTPSDQSSALSVTQAVISALADLARTSKEACTIVPDDARAPDLQRQSVEVRCGSHYVSVSATRFRESNIIGINEAWYLYPDRR